MDFANERLETVLKSKDTVVGKARDLRRAQRARIAAPVGPQKAQAKTREHMAARDLGFAVDTYEKELAKQRRQADEGEH